MVPFSFLRIRRSPPQAPTELSPRPVYGVAAARRSWPEQKRQRIDPSNVMSRVLKPAAIEAGLGEWVGEGAHLRADTWVGFHTFKHTGDNHRLCLSSSIVG